MSPETGLPAYRQHLPSRRASPWEASWRERLARNAGVTIDAGSGCVLPREGWDAVDDAAMASLVDPDGARDHAAPNISGCCSFPTPAAGLVDVCGTRGSPGDARFEPVFAEMTEFLRFKGLPLPEPGSPSRWR